MLQKCWRFLHIFNIIEVDDEKYRELTKIKNISEVEVKERRENGNKSLYEPNIKISDWYRKEDDREKYWKEFVINIGKKEWRKFLSKNWRRLKMRNDLYLSRNRRVSGEGKIYPFLW